MAFDQLLEGDSLHVGGVGDLRREQNLSLTVGYRVLLRTEPGSHQWSSPAASLSPELWSWCGTDLWELSSARTSPSRHP